MDLVLCHITADFDTLGAAVGVTRLQPGSRIVLAAGTHPTVQAFLALHRDEYPLIERRAVDLDHVRSLTVVDTQFRQRLGPLAPWLDYAQEQQLPVHVYDHHPGAGDIAYTYGWIEPVGAAATLVAEQLQQQGLQLSVAEATAMALGIHVDTGSLVFEQATARDAAALTWLMAQGASQRAVAEFVQPGLSRPLQKLMEQALRSLQRQRLQGYELSRVLLKLPDYVPGLSGVVERLMSASDSDVLLFGGYYPHRDDTWKLTLIARARGRVTQEGGIDLQQLLTAVGGGGHGAAAAATLTVNDPQPLWEQLWGELRSQLPTPPTARSLMSSPVRTIRPDTPIRSAQRILLRYGHSGLSVVSHDDQLVGIISRRDIDLALHHGFGHAPVKGYMTTEVKTITPDTPLPQIETLMVTYDIGRLPVLADNQLVGIVTRTDVLRQLHQDQLHSREDGQPALPVAVPRYRPEDLYRQLQQTLDPPLWALLQAIASTAQQRGWHLYVVGGAVRDLLQTSEPHSSLQDIDLVVDGFYQSAETGAGLALAEAVKSLYPEVELQAYGRFQTAALVWHRDLKSPLAGLMVDIATARTEFYPYPAANPEVEASSIRQDLYRRDFTINAMAIRLTQPQPGLLLDFFGGLMDLQRQQIRVLHVNSFIEDPTRIYRAVRFAVRLGFTLDPQTESQIHHAIESGIYLQMQRQMARLPALQVRLRNELKYILEALYWQPALGLLDRLGALRCLHDQLAVSQRLWHQLRRISRWIDRFGGEALAPWQLRLELLLAELPVAERSQVAEFLQLPVESQQRLEQLASQEERLSQILPGWERPSQVAVQLQGLDRPTLLLIAARHPRPLGQIIWRYLTQWSAVKAPLNGHDLKRLGYPPGPQYRTLLEALTVATLDGRIGDRDQAETFLRTEFPLSGGA